jgi:hypothetical protein
VMELKLYVSPRAFYSEVIYHAVARQEYARGQSIQTVVLRATMQVGIASGVELHSTPLRSRSFPGCIRMAIAMIHAFCIPKISRIPAMFRETSITAVVALFASRTLAVDNGLAITPQMGWVSFQ